jgi:aspartate 1-decarboxylase
MKFVLSSKIFKATVTESNLDYKGCITIYKNLCDKAAGEKSKF